MSAPTTRVRAILASTETFAEYEARRVARNLLPAALDVVEIAEALCDDPMVKTHGMIPAESYLDLRAALDAYHAKERETLGS